MKDDPTTSSFYAPFESMNARLDASEQERLETEAKRVIAGTVMPAFAGLAEFLRESYAASASPGASELPGGADYYAFQIRRYTTLTDATADSIHETGITPDVLVEDNGGFPSLSLSGKADRENDGQLLEAITRLQRNHVMHSNAQ